MVTGARHYRRNPDGTRSEVEHEEALEPVVFDHPCPHCSEWYSRELEEARLELARLRAQVASFTSTRYSCRPEAWPDDTEANREIAEAEDLGEALWALGDKYEVPMTNNSERWKNGVFLRHVGEFKEDLEAIAGRFLEQHLHEELQEQIARACSAEAEVSRLALALRLRLRDWRWRLARSVSHE